MQQSSVVVGLEESGLQAEILDYLTRLPRVRVVETASDGKTFERGVRDVRPDAAVVSPEVLRSASDLDGAAVLVVAGGETTEALRLALRVGARGFFVWPEDREALARALERAARPGGTDPAPSGRVVAVYGPRGGSGVTFLATNLAAACAARGASSVLVDLDPFFSDVSVALGVSPNGTTRTIAELRPVLDELSVEHVERVLHPHPRGFGLLLAPTKPGSVDLLPRHVAALSRTLRKAADVAILHLPRSLDATTVAAMEAADDVVLVVTLDVLAFRDARRTLEHLDELGIRDRCSLVINRAGRAEVAPQDAEHVFGLRPVSVIRADRSVGRAQNRGEVLVGRSGPAARRVAALAGSLLEGTTRRGDAV